MLWLLTATAFAQTAEIKDEVGLLSYADVSRVQAAAASWPFQFRLLVRNGVSPDMLEEAAHQGVSNGRVVAVAMSPALRKLYVRFGVDLGVPSQDFDPIADASKPYFRGGRWAEGIVAIGERARASVHEAPPAYVPQAPQPAPMQQPLPNYSTTPVVSVPARDDSGIGWVWWVVLTLMAGGFVWWVLRRIRASASVEEPEPSYVSPPYRAPSTASPASLRPMPQPAPVQREVHHHYGSGGGSGVRDFVAGAAVGAVVTAAVDRASAKSSEREDTVKKKKPVDDGGGESSWSDTSATDNDSAAVAAVETSTRKSSNGGSSDWGSSKKSDSGGSSSWSSNDSGGSSDWGSSSSSDSGGSSSWSDSGGSSDGGGGSSSW